MTLTNVLFGTFALREHQAHILTVIDTSIDFSWPRSSPRTLRTFASSRHAGPRHKNLRAHSLWR